MKLRQAMVGFDTVLVLGKKVPCISHARVKVHLLRWLVLDKPKAYAQESLWYLYVTRIEVLCIVTLLLASQADINTPGRCQQECLSMQGQTAIKLMYIGTPTRYRGQRPHSLQNDGNWCFLGRVMGDVQLITPILLIK